MKIDYSPHFLRKSRTLSFGDVKKLSEKIEWFRKDPYDSRLKTHALTGKLKGFFSFSITHSKRVKFLFVSKDAVLFFDVGSHDEVYR